MKTYSLIFKGAGELKKHTTSVHDQARENKILQAVSQQAENSGYPASIHIFKV